MRKIKVLLLFVLFFLSSQAEGQVRSFNADPTIFMQELEGLFKGVEDKETLKDFAVFKENWLNGKFTPTQQKFMMQVSNDMLTNQMPVLPYFKLFYGSITRFLEKKMPDKTLAQWQVVARNILSNSSEDYLEFLKTTEQLFATKTLFINENKRWFVDTNNYDIKLIKGKVALDFGDVTLTCKSLSDKIVIYKTKGIYYPGSSVWEGQYGTTDFSRAIPEDKTQIVFKKYTINFNKAQYELDTVSLIYPKYFKEPILGKFSDKLMFSLDSNTVKTGGYPKFTSFKNNLLVRGIVGSESFFRGGFSMNGGVINTSTVDNKPSFIDIFYKGKKKVTLKSTGFRIANGVASSSNIEFTLFLDSGKTISHPSATVKFIFKENRLVVTRGEDGLMRGAFADDYHNMSIDVEQVKWKIDEPYVDFDNLNDDKAVKFESNDFFRNMIYEKWQGPLKYNPLEQLNVYYLRTPPDPVSDRMEKEIKAMYADKNADKLIIQSKIKELQDRRATAKRAIDFKSRNKFTLDDFCAYYKVEPNNTKHLFIELHDAGFVNYNFKNDSITINRKLFKYNLMHKKAIDYDVIRLNSVIAAKPNATLNLLSNEMNIEGVRSCFFSDSQNVSVKPVDQQVTLTSNRNLRFGGMVRAGRFDFYGQRFNFNYARFQIDFANIDSMQMFFPDESGQRLIPIKSVLRNIGGTLYIDKPNNKSGNINYPEYPIFTSNKGSDILYDKPSIHGGQYKGDVFKFVVDPFTIDSLDNFTIQGLRFEGMFYSDGIFPDFRHYAYIQPDYSLGFVKHTPGFYPMYRGKGKGDMTMNLSEMGFYGEAGEINYESSVTKFDKMLLLPKQAKGLVKSYDLAENAKYPEVHALDASLNWMPYDDKYSITQGKSPIKMFNFGYDFEGMITQSPSKVIGDGLLRWDLATFKSKEMVFGPKKAKVEVGELTIFTADSTKIAFNSKNIHGTMDFSKRVGEFATNETGQVTNFPFNRYQTNLSDYKWDMDQKTIEARVGAGMGGITPEFLSTNVLQDSLKFESPKAVYSLKDYTLKAERIPYIDIADSRLFLKDGKVTIRENADMDELDSAKLIANRDDKFHEIYRLKIKVHGRNRVRGSGYYQYVDKLAKRQEFLLDSVIVNRAKHIEGIGKIEEEKGFTLDKKIGYKGLAQIESHEQLIKFMGFVKPLHTFTNVLPSAWLQFKNYVDPKDVVIPLSNPRDKMNTKQFVGLYIANDSSHVYPLMFSARRRYSDNDVSNDTGILYYDHTKESFMIGSEDKLRNAGTKGSFIQFNEKDHSIHAEGPMDFGLESEHIKFKNAGHADLKPGDSSFSFNLAMMLDFPLPDEFVKYLLSKVVDPEEPGTADLNTDFFKDALGEMVAEPKVYRNIIQGIEKNNKLEGKAEAKYKLILSDATFRWDNKMRGMYCNDNVIVASIAGEPVNKEMKAVMLLESKRAGENMYVYLNYGDDYVFFNISKNKCAIYASDPKLTEILVNNAEKIKAKDYYIIQTTERNVDKFLRKIER